SGWSARVVPATAKATSNASRAAAIRMRKLLSVSSGSTATIRVAPSRQVLYAGRMPQFIFTMRDVRKVTSQGKEILKRIRLSFYDGAKIGVIGANGAGKSTLLRIMA